MTQYPAFIRTYVPLAVSAIVGWLASLGINVSDEAQTALAIGAGGVAAAAYYGIVRALEKRWPALGVLLGSTKTPDGYSTGGQDDALVDTPEVIDDVDDEPEDDDTDDEAEGEPETEDEVVDDITDDLEDEPAPTGRHSA